MSDYEKAVFISYAWGEETDEREAIVNQLDRSLRARGITIIRDKRDLGYKGMIRGFMQRIGAGHCVIVVISDKYLRSKNCMFELVEIAANKDFADRVFPIVLSDAKIYEAVDRIDYLTHWEQKKADLDAKMRSLKELTHTPGISEELNDYDRFRDEIDRLTTVIKNMNTLSPDILRGTDFQPLYEALLKRMGPVWAETNAETHSPTPSLTHDLPPGSYLPFPRNHYFTGRIADLEKLSKALLNDSQAGIVINQNQAVTGMGGLGKTQLAVEFAYRYGYQFKGVHWLDLREAGTLESQIALCGSKMDLPNYPPTQPELVLDTVNEWKQNGPRLLILDNFEEPGAANDVLAALTHSNLRLLITSRRADWSTRLGLNRLPLDEFSEDESLNFEEPGAANDVLAALTHSNLRLLITSRRADWSTRLGLNRLPLDEFSEDESLAFLRQYIPAERENDTELKTLAKHLGYLPLALELAGRYLEKQARLTIKEYLTQLDKALEHKSMQNWKAEQKSLTGHDLSLLQTFAQSWEQVKSPTTQKLFICLGYCAPNTPLSYEILDAALGDEKENCDECMGELLGLGLLKAGNLIHPLLAEYARGFDKDNQHLKSFSEAIASLATKTTKDEDQSGNYSLYTPLLPHIRSLAEYAEKAEIKETGTLWNEIGYHILKLADYTGAKAAYERALQIFEKQLGKDHPNVATLVNNLGGVLHDLGDHAGAKAAYGRALMIDEAAFGPDHPKVAIRVNNLGLVLQDLGDLPGAKAAFERALQIGEATLGPDHPKVAIRVNNLGLVLQALGDLPGAKAAFERALQIDEAAFGPDHPAVARGVNNLGNVLKDLGDLQGAKTAFERTLQIWEAALGSDHPQVATGVNNLGLVLQDLGNLPGAKAAHERALRIDEAAFGPDHPNVAIDVNNLGGVLKALGDLPGAKAAYERALKIWEAALGSDHPQVATGVNNLGSVLQDLGDLPGAKAAFERALRILEKFLPPDHPNIQIVRENLASL